MQTFEKNQLGKTLKLGEGKKRKKKKSPEQDFRYRLKEVVIIIY